MKKIFCLMLIVLMCLVGCADDRKSSISEIERKRKDEAIACLEEELSGYIATEQSTLREIPLEEITTKSDEIVNYKGVISDNANMYVILETSSVNSEFAKDFELFFSNKYFMYQSFVFYNDVHVYVYNGLNDVNVDAIKNKCVKESLVLEGEAMDSDIIASLKETSKVIVKTRDLEIGAIDNLVLIEELLDLLETSRGYQGNYSTDWYSFELELYKDNSELIDRIYVWQDGENFALASDENTYYVTTKGSFGINRIIEEGTDYKFFGIIDYTEFSDNDLELIYQDTKYNYYLSCGECDKVIINFYLSRIRMNLKYALENNYLLVEDLYREKPDFLIRKEK